MATRKKNKLSAFERFKSEHSSSYWKEFAESNEEDYLRRKYKEERLPKKDDSNLAEKLGRLLAKGAAKTVNSAAEGVADIGETGRALLARATGDKAAEAAAVRRGMSNHFLDEGSGLLGVGGIQSNENARNGSAGRFVRDVAGTGLETAAEVVPFGRGLSLASKGGKLSTTLGRGAAEGGIYGAVGSTGSQLADDGRVDLKKVALDAGLSGVMGALGAGVGRAVGRGRDATKLRNLTPEQLRERSLASTPEGLGDVNVEGASRHLDAQDAYTASTKQGITDPGRLLPMGETRAQAAQRRLGEIDNELTAIKEDPNYTYNPDKGEMGSYSKVTDDPNAVITDGRFKSDGTLDMRFSSSKKAGTIAPSDQLTDSSLKVTRARELMRERRQLQDQLEGADAIQNVDKIDMSKPKNVQAVKAEANNIERALAPEGEKITGKVNTLRDYVTNGMTDTFRRIGLGKTAKLVENSFEGMRKEQLVKARQVSKWVRQVKGDPEAAQKIFRSLDGDTSVPLSKSEQKVADEMRAAYSEYADRLGIPKQKRLTNYITRIFDKDIKAQKKGEPSDPALDAILSKRVGGNIKNPFLEKRLGKEGYIEDAFKAFEVYAQKASRQIHMQPAVDAISAASKANKDIDQATADYLISSANTLLHRQQHVDRIVDNVVDSVLGTNRGGTRALRGTRSLTYAGTMGGNVGSAVQNITQGVNTFAELGTKNTLAGYSKFMRVMADAAMQKKAGKEITALDELLDMGVWDDSIVRESQKITGLKSNLRKIDDGLWAMFNATERMNRASAYYAAKHAALKAGKSEEAAREAGVRMVAKTQFKFNDIETPIGLQSDVAKSLAQFQSYNIRQTKFLAKMAQGVLKGDKQEIAKAIRWIGANAVVYGTLGQLIGMDWKNGIPILNFRGVTSPVIQAGQIAYHTARGEDQYGNDVGYGEAALSGGKKLGAMFIPGGTQAKKTLEGLQSGSQGYSATDKGRIRFQEPTDASGRLQQAIFGQYSTREARDFYANGGKNLTEKQSERFANASPEVQQQLFDFYTGIQKVSSQKRSVNEQITKAIKEGNINKAERLAAQYNNSLNDHLEEFFGKYPNPDEEIVDDADGLKIRLTRARIKRAQKET